MGAAVAERVAPERVAGHRWQASFTGFTVLTNRKMSLGAQTMKWDLINQIEFKMKRVIIIFNTSCHWGAIKPQVKIRWGQWLHVIP